MEFFRNHINSFTFSSGLSQAKHSLNKIKTAILILAFGGLVGTGCAQNPNQEIASLREQLESLQREVKALKRASGAGGILIPEVVAEVIPAVVSIHSEKFVESPLGGFNPFEDFFFFGEPRTPQRQPEKRKQQGLGSGVIISKEGYILTNHHVAGEADELKVTFSDDRTFEAEIVGTDKLSDLAVIKLKNPPKDLHVLPFGNSDSVKIGEAVIAVGNPFGYSNTVTEGIISARGRQVGLNSYESYLQTDASINPGNSGGALVNLRGELIGINTAIASRSGASHGIGFAIPINMAQTIYNQLVNKGAVSRGYLGVYLQEIDENLVEALNLKSKSGALVSKVIEDSPAEKAGLRETDVITAIDNKKIKDVNELRNRVALLQPNKEYIFTYLREGTEKTTKIKIGERDNNELAGNNPEGEKQKDLGLELTELDQRLAYQYRLNRSSGLLVTSVKPGTPGDKSGFQEGDIILQVGKIKVTQITHWKKALKDAQKSTVMVLLERAGVNLFTALKVP